MAILGFSNNTNEPNLMIYSLLKNSNFLVYKVLSTLTISSPFTLLLFYNLILLSYL